ncbi:hypothetical protein PL741_05645 [Bifidobacterium breve]|nr:hypothetical protein [Bifidobacterium breve]
MKKPAKENQEQSKGLTMTSKVRKGIRRTIAALAAHRFSDVCLSLLRWVEHGS